MAEPTLSLYKEAFLNAENPMIITDTNYELVGFNQALVEFTGYSGEEMLGRPPVMFFSDPATLEEVIGTLEDGGSWEGYFETETKHGEMIYGRGSAMPLSVDGDIQGYGGIFVDLTDRRRYEQTLKVIYRLLRHDLRNEMTLVQGYAETVAAQVSDEELLDTLRKLESVTDRLIRRSEKARELEQVLFEGFEQPRQPVDVADVVGQEVQAAREKHANAAYVLESVPETHVYANDMLKRVFESILENAAIHNERPQVKISGQESGDRVEIAIADDGVGIPEENRDQIFGQAERNQLDHGEGFSLYFVDLVVDTYGGDVAVTENDMGGATFTISLPKAT